LFESNCCQLFTGIDFCIILNYTNYYMNLMTAVKASNQWMNTPFIKTEHYIRITKHLLTTLPSESERIAQLDTKIGEGDLRAAIHGHTYSHRVRSSNTIDVDTAGA